MQRNVAIKVINFSSRHIDYRQQTIFHISLDCIASKLFGQFSCENVFVEMYVNLCIYYLVSYFQTW